MDASVDVNLHAGRNTLTQLENYFKVLKAFGRTFIFLNYAMFLVFGRRHGT